MIEICHTLRQTRQDAGDPACLYSGQAFRIRRTYTTAMALRIKELRDQKGWTQAELASRSNMSRSQLAMIETETRPANTLRLNSIAAALDVTPEDLFVSSGWRSRLSAATKNLSEADREMLVHMAEALAAKAQKAE